MSDSGQAVNPGAPGRPTRGERVLVVDDRPDSRGVTVRFLEREGFEVDTAGSGREALEKLASSPYQLVLLDILLPDITGHEVLESLRTRTGKLAPPPVIVLSVDREIASIVRAVELGADDYLAKPIDRVLLNARVNATLDKARLRRHEQQLLSDVKLEREKSDRLLRSVLPPRVVARLKNGEERIADTVRDATILVAGIHDWPRLAGRMEPSEVVDLLGAIFTEFDALAERCGAENLKTVGHLYYASAGVTTKGTGKENAAKAADLALEIQRTVCRFATKAGDPLVIRAGMDSGTLVAGVVGAGRLAFDVWGRPVVMAAHMELSGVAGGIQISESVRERLGHDYEIDERGTYFVQGIGEVVTYLLKGQA